MRCSCCRSRTPRAGARFTVAWRVHRSFDPHPVYPGMVPFGAFTVTDDRGRRYRLDFAGSDGPEWSGEVELRPGRPATCAGWTSRRRAARPSGSAWTRTPPARRRRGARGQPADASAPASSC